jgi:peptide deformylase
MARLKIAQLGEPVLRQRAREVSREELDRSDVQRLLDDMVETMRDADGVGIAAPQVFASMRLCVAEVAQNPRYPEAPSLPLTYFVNPVVTPLLGTEQTLADDQAIVMFEGCLSVSGVRGRVRRPRRVRVDAIDRRGAPFSLTLEGVLAAVIQHELDHLDGVLFVDRADPRTLTFLREYERHVPVEERVVDGGAA